MAEPTVTLDTETGFPIDAEGNPLRMDDQGGVWSLEGNFLGQVSEQGEFIPAEEPGGTPPLVGSESSGSTVGFDDSGWPVDAEGNHLKMDDEGRVYRENGTFLGVLQQDGTFKTVQDLGAREALEGVAETTATPTQMFRSAVGPFEPLFLPQDLLFNAIDAALDEDLSFTEAMNRIDWAAYAPNLGNFDFGLNAGTPDRFVNADDLLEKAGVPEQYGLRAAAGFILDVTADPLIVGSWIRKAGEGASIAARAAGGESAAASVMATARQLGGIFDAAVAPSTYLGAAGKLPNPITRQRVEQDVERLISFVSNIQPGRPFIRGEAGDLSYTIGDLFRQPDAATRAQFGPEAGQGIVEARRRGEAQAGVVQTESVRTIDLLDRMLGGPGMRITWGQRGARIITEGAQAREAIVADVPQSVADAILRTSQEVGDTNGVLLLSKYGLEPQREVMGRGLSGFLSEVRSLFAGVEVPVNDLTSFAVRRDTAVQQVRRAAQDVGFDPARAERLFDEVLTNAVYTDAMQGYHFSMYEPIKANFVNEMNLAFGSREMAQKFWTDIFQLRRQNPSLDIRTIDRFGPETDMTISAITGGRYETVGDIMAKNPQLAELNLNDYIDSVWGGHLRRSYGMFMDPAGFAGYLEMARNGKLIPNQVIGDPENYMDLFRSSGLGDEGAAIVDYMNNVAVNTRTGGGVVTWDQVYRYLTDERGFDPENAQSALFALVGTGQSPLYKEFLKKVEDAVAAHQSVYRRNTAAARITERQDLRPEDYDVLMELLNPMVSIAEGGQMAGRLIPRQEFLTAVLEHGRNAGMIATESRPNWIRYGGDADRAILGELSDYWIHPFAAKHVENALINPNARPAVLSGMLRTVAGGFLASPSSTVANVSGGLLTAGLAGLETGRMMAHMLSELPNVVRAYADPQFVWRELDEVSQFADIGAQGMLYQGVLDPKDVLARLEERLGRVDPNDPSQVVEAVSDVYHNILGVAGLDAFGGAEILMRVAAFKTAKDMGFVPMEAAEYARISTFDYTQLPAVLDSLKESGIAVFPGFPYFMAGRLVSGALNQPGRLSVAMSIPDAIAESTLTDEQKAAWWAATQGTWMEDEMMGPNPFIPFTDTVREGATGEVGVGFPWQQALPTNPISLTVPMAGGISTAGIPGAFLDVGMALASGTGESTLFAQYGKRVFSAGAPAHEVALDIAGYMYNNLAPAFARKTVSYDPDAGWTGGVVGGLRDSAFPIPEEFQDFVNELSGTGVTYRELIEGRESRDTAENIASLFIRTLQPIELEGEFGQAPQDLRNAARDAIRTMQAMQNEMLNATNPERKAVLEQRIRDYQEEFLREWGAVIEYLREDYRP